MRKCVFLTALTVGVFATIAAHGLDARMINVSFPEGFTGYTPVCLPYDGHAPGGRVEVIDRRTGEGYPATIHGGRLTFLLPDALAGGEHQFQVRVHPANNPPRVRVNLDQAEQQAEVHVRDEHFTTYQFADDSRIPHLWPMYAEGGVTITRNFPMGKDEPVESTDHRHHKSFWIAFGDVNGYDNWHRVPILTQKVEAGSGDAYGWIRAENVWPDADGEPIVDESREYRFYDTPASARIFDQKITFTASYGDVTFGDDKEGLVAFRIRPEIQGRNAGLLTNFEGNQGERAVYGTPGPWMDYSGPIEGVGYRGIALFSHPSNLREPAWHVRDYGLAASNPFAMSDVARLGEDGSYVLEEGETLTFLFRAYIHTGDVEQADVAGQYKAFAEGATAEWAEQG